MKNTILLIALFIVVAAVSLFAYQKSHRSQNSAAAHIDRISLEYYSKRGVVQKPQPKIAPETTVETTPEEKNETVKLNLAPAIFEADAWFEKEPKQALARYAQLLEQDPGNLSLHLRLGMLFLKLRQYDAAKEHLYMVYEQKETGLQSDAAWFLALLSIEEQQFDKAKSLLQESSDKKSNYRDEAAVLLASF